MGGRPQKAVAVREGLFTQDGPPRLLGSRCDSCGETHFPRASTCPFCASRSTSDIELSSEGTLWAWTSVASRPPGYRGEVPYGFGVVELPEGVRVVSRLTEPDVARLSFGEPMRLVRAPLHTDDEGHQVLTWAFEPVRRAP